MKINVKKGKYIVAVSGGVDSMVLLDLLSKKLGLELIVAHFNHGIREDSNNDEMLVRDTAARYGLPFKAGYGRLRAGTSEDKAREARYSYLRSIKKMYEADAIITAHHQDDLIETVLINLLRGTGWRGLTSISANKEVIRPLMNFQKSEIRDYAYKYNIKWYEDFTNQENDYLRNYLRNEALKELNEEKRSNIILNINKVAEISKKLETHTATLSQYINEQDKIDRVLFSLLPYEVGKELIMLWLREKSLSQYDKPTIDRLEVIIRTGKPMTKYNIKNNLWLKLDSKKAKIVTIDTSAKVKKQLV